MYSQLLKNGPILLWSRTQISDIDSTGQLASHSIKNIDMHLVLQPLNQPHFILLNWELKPVVLHLQAEIVGNSEHCFRTRFIYSNKVKTC
jgi:hypothetical protein